MKRLRYIVQIAFKDAIQNLTSLSILASCCFIGTLALVSISLLKNGVDTSIINNTKSLLSADFLITSRQAPSPEVKRFINDLGKSLDTKLESTSEIALASMALFKSSNQSRLIQLSAVGNSYPLYGKVETNLDERLEINPGYAAVDSNLKARYDLKMGDEIKIGNKDFKISAFILQMPGSISTRSILAPRILINIADIQDTHLIKRGSLARYLFYIKTTNEIPNKELKEKLSDKILKYNLTLETSDEKRTSIERTVAIAYNFLDVVTFISFLLGGIGIASGSFIYFRKKKEFIKTLVCLGLKKNEAVVFFSVQILLFGLLSIALASASGLLINTALPGLFSGHLPIELSGKLNVTVFLRAIVTSIGLLALCTSLAAVLIWKENVLKKISSTVIFLIFTLVVVFVWGKLITGDFKLSSIYTISILLLIIILAVLGFLLRYVAKQFSSNFAKFEFEQGIKNLYRPNNQTFLLFSTIGISSLSIYLALFIGTLAGNKITKMNDEGSSNLLLFDIQEYQLEGVKDLLDSSKLPLVSTFPIVNMRLEKMNGVDVTEIRKAQANKTSKPRWTLTREYRSTFKSSLDATEDVIEGNFIGEIDNNVLKNQKIPISIEKGIAEKLELKMLDTITFNIQGLQVNTYISSIRKVDWQQMKPNFFFIFPSGILEDAPKNFIVLSKYASESQNNSFQSELVKSFGNVSSIDLSLLLKTITAISNQLKGIIDFLTLIVISNSIIILIGIILGSRAIRIEENTILRTLGARDRVIQTIALIEYVFIAIFGALSGLIIAIVASMLVGNRVFNVYPVFDFNEIGLIFILFILSITLIGILGSLGTLRRPTLETLRAIE